MNAQAVAVIIAGALTVIGTLAAQYFGRRATSKQLDRMLGEQREQLDRTLAVQRVRTLNERFATAAEQLGTDKPSAVRLAGVYANSCMPLFCHVLITFGVTLPLACGVPPRRPGAACGVRRHR
jgi:hypothetical protein